MSQLAMMQMTPLCIIGIIDIAVHLTAVPLTPVCNQRFFKHLRE
jgi:hypothetical protein